MPFPLKPWIQNKTQLPGYVLMTIRQLINIAALRLEPF